MNFDLDENYSNKIDGATAASGGQRQFNNGYKVDELKGFWECTRPCGNN
jgi:hypothetical protein